MSDARVIEIGEEAVGLVARDERGYRFYAATSAFLALEGKVFATTAKAQRAVVDFHRKSTTPRKRASSRSRPAAAAASPVSQ